MNSMRRKITFRSATGELAAVRAGVRDFLEQAGMEECAREAIVLALDEACTNVIRHAYHSACRQVRMEMEYSAGQIRFTLRDYGKPCDPDKIRSRDLADIRPGGVGVHIIRQVFDSVTYTPCPRGTRLVMIKALPSASVL